MLHKYKQNNPDHINVSPETLFGQTKSVPGIIYRILRNDENNYYDSLNSVRFIPAASSTGHSEILYHEHARIEITPYPGLTGKA